MRPWIRKLRFSWIFAPRSVRYVASTRAGPPGAGARAAHGLPHAGAGPPGHSILHNFSYRVESI